MKDRSLDDFAGDDTSADAGESEREAKKATDDADVTGETTSDEPAEVGSEDDAALATARWDPGGVECPSCGETAERRWRADEESAEFVCVDCKEW